MRCTGGQRRCRSVLRRGRELWARFDRIFQRITGFAALDRLLKRLHANKAEVLRVLDHPEGPLHTNGAEDDIRCQITTRAISGGTQSDTGRDCRDAFLGLAGRPAASPASPSGMTSVPGSVSPVLGRMRPPNILDSLRFSQPPVPIRQRNPPLHTVSDVSCKAWTWPWAETNRWETTTISIAASAVQCSV